MSRIKLWLLLLTLVTVWPGSSGSAQPADTVRIDASHIDTKVLIPGVHRYLVYFKNGKDSSRVRYQMWTRNIEFVRYEGKDAIRVKQEWESNSQVFHRVTSYSEKTTFAPLYQESWWSTAGTWKFDFVHNIAIVNGKSLAESVDSAGKSQWSAFEAARGQYILNWHLDLEVFPMLPFKEHTTFLINFYDPGFSAPEFVPYAVTGSGTLKGYEGQDIACWLLETHDDKNHEVFWISKKTREVLKLDQQYGSTFRYKIKLPFSE
ncbi:MAG TPA: hypothetical protein VI758_12880 [Bacteroidota bacterium]